MAILYKANETDFSHLGLGLLNDAVSILVTEERNGIFELEMKYPVSGKLFNELKNDRLIKADAGHKLKDQRFKIIRISKPLNGIVTVYAEHVSYLTQDLALKPKVTFTGNARQALEHWKANLVDDNPFTVWSDITTVGNINWTIDEVENARRALGGVQGSILDVYGGEYLFDNYDIYLYQKRGVNSELLIAYGRNLVDLEQEEEIANTYTSIYPYSIYTDDDGNEQMVTLPEFYIDSEHVDKYARRKILVVDFTTDEIETVSALRSAARRYIEDNDIGVPRVNLKIKYLDLAKTLDYKDLALYEEVNLCDNVMIYFEKYDINTTAKVIKVVWDALQDRYDSIEVGEARSSLSQAIDTVVDGKVEKTERLSMRAIRTADGKNTIYYGLDEPTGDLKKGDLWFRVVDGEYTRTYRYDGVAWQLIMDMDSQEAKQAAQQAKDEAQQAVDRANQATQQATNAINQAQTAFDEAQQALGTANNAMTQATSAFSLANDAFNEVESLSTIVDENTGEISTIKQSVIGLQTQVSDNAGNISSLTQIAQGLQTQVTDIEGNVTTLQQTAQGLQSSVTNLQDELDGIEIGGRNFIRDSDKFYPGDSGNSFPTTQDIIDLLNESDYVTASVYVEVVNAQPSGDNRIGYELGVRYEDGSIGTIRVWVNPSPGENIKGRFSNTFDLRNSKKVTELRHHGIYRQTGGDYLKVGRPKLEKGNKATDWTPALEDIDHQFSVITQTIDSITTRVGDAEGNITALQQTSSSLAARLSDAEGNITTLTATINGLQTTVSNVQGDVSNVTQLANALQVRMTDAEGNISTLTQTASSLQSTISDVRADLDGLEIGGRNFIRGFNYWTKTSRATVEYPWRLVLHATAPDQKSHLSGKNIPVEPNTTYTFHAKTGRYEINQRDKDGNYLRGIKYPTDEGEILTFTTGSDCYYVGLFTYNDSAGTFVYEYPKLEKGNKATDWTPAPEDMATQSQITQLSDAINLRVEKGDVINQINLDTSGVLISGKKLILDGDTTVTGTFRVGNANITSLDAGKLMSGTLDAGKISVINLSANSIVGGILQSQNSNTTFNLNTGELYFENNNITFGNSANIDFTSTGNRLTYRYTSGITRSSGLGVGLALGGEYPYAFLGTTGAPDLDTLSQWFSGFIANTTARIAEGGANSVTGNRFQFRNTAVGFDKVIEVDFFGSRPYIAPLYPASYNHDLGTENRPWDRLYVNYMRVIGDFAIRNRNNIAQGWGMETSSQASDRGIAFYPLDPAQRNYDIGRSTHRINWIYLKNNPSVSSDERLKEDITSVDLGLDFIRDLELNSFRLKATTADVNQGLTRNKKQYGIIAQQLRDTLVNHGVDVNDITMIDQADDGMYSVQYEQLIPIAFKGIQDLDFKIESVTDDVEWLKLENQYLRQKVKQLEEMIA